MAGDKVRITTVTSDTPERPMFLWSALFVVMGPSMAPPCSQPVKHYYTYNEQVANKS